MSDRDFDGLYESGPGIGDDDFYDEHYTRRGPVRRWMGCLLPLAILAGLVFGGYQAYEHLMNYFGGTSCKVVSDGFDYQWDPEQTANAATIVDVGTLKMGLPHRASQIAVTTAIQESKLRNLRYGDLDSLGLFQQRPSQGWGTADQVQDPVYSSASFYRALTEIDGWQQLPVGEAAQEVQRSGYPDAYADHTTQGRTLTRVLSGQRPEGIGCRLDPAESSTSPADLVDKLAEQTGVRATAGTGQVSYRAEDRRTAHAVAAWAIAHAEAEGITAVTVGDRAWERERGQEGWTWQASTTPTKDATTVRIDLAGDAG